MQNTLVSLCHQQTVWRSRRPQPVKSGWRIFSELSGESGNSGGAGDGCTFLHTECLPAAARVLSILILKMKAQAVKSRGRRRSRRRRGITDPRGGWGNMGASMVQVCVLFVCPSLVLGTHRCLVNASRLLNEHVIQGRGACLQLPRPSPEFLACRIETKHSSLAL